MARKLQGKSQGKSLSSYLLKSRSKHKEIPGEIAVIISSQKWVEMSGKKRVEMSGGSKHLVITVTYHNLDTKTLFLVKYTYVDLFCVKYALTQAQVFY